MKPWTRAIAPLALATECLALAVFERRSPLRARREALVVHVRRNLIVALLAAIPAIVLEAPLARYAMRVAAERRFGALARLPLPPPIRTVATILLLDYSLYHWHRLTHRVPFLWRFHQVHHIDRDCDTTTAIRFHFGELTASVLYRACAVAAIGATPESYALWQQLLLASIVFHHANVRLPAAFETFASWFVMTPRLHGIHHAERQSLEESNWSSGLALWDRLHGSFRPSGNDDPSETGLAAFRDDRAVALPQILTQPFRTQRDVWSVGAPV